MKKEEFTRKEVVLIIHQLLQMPDLLIDAFENEHTDNGAEELLEIGEKVLSKKDSIEAFLEHHKYDSEP